MLSIREGTLMDDDDTDDQLLDLAIAWERAVIENALRGANSIQTLNDSHLRLKPMVMRQGS